MKLVNTSDKFDKALQTFEGIDDFEELVTGDRWTLTATDSGGGTVQDDVNGELQLDASDGTVADNDETYITSFKKHFKFQASKPGRVVFRVKLSEANTDDANIIIGLCSAAIADSLQDDGAGPPADYSGACFFKVDGGTNWNVEKSLSTTQNSVELTAANSLDGDAHALAADTYEDFEIRWTPGGGSSGTKCDFDFFIDGTHVYRMKDEDITSAAAMHIIAGVKNGSANEEKLDIDLIAWAVER